MRQGCTDPERKDTCQSTHPQKIREGFQQKAVYCESGRKIQAYNSPQKISGTITAYPFGDSVHVTFTDDRIDDSLSDYL